MAFELGMFAVMEYLWETLEKTPDGRAIRYTPFDVELLWKMGFVDTSVFTMERWQEVFEPYRQQDGSFHLEKDAFIALDKYRYKGEVHIPFDATRINEGLYTDEGLQELIDASIAPSCSLAKEQLKDFFDQLKELYRAPDGLIKIKTEAKLEIKQLIEKNPSPLRNLELLFDQMLAQGKDVEMEGKIDGAEAERATAQAALEASSFRASPLTKSETLSTELKKLQKSKGHVKPESAEAPTVPLKKIKRSRKGMRG